MTQVRRDLLLKDQKTDKSDALVVALARQGYLNEYVFFVSDQERASLKALKDENPDQLDPDLIARLACYEPLHKLGVTRESCTDARLEPLIVQQIDEPAREVELRAALPRREVVVEKFGLGRVVGFRDRASDDEGHLQL